MPESGGAEFAAYAVSYSKQARESRRELPEAYQTALLDIVDELSEDPERHPHRVRPLYAGVSLYRHPDPPVEITFAVDRERGVLQLLHFAATVLKVRRDVFISYSHDDSKWLEELRKWLVPLEREDKIRLWDDRQIAPGSEWRKEIEANLETAKLALLLVSQNFIASEFIANHELPELLEGAERRGVVILCVAVGESAFEDTELGKFQFVNDPGEPLEALEQSARARALKQIYRKIKEASERPN